MSVQNSYNILNKFEIPVAKEELEQVDLLKYTWEKLLSQANEVQNKLIGIQPNFRQELVENIVKFDDECSTFYENYFKVRFANDHIIIKSCNITNAFFSEWPDGWKCSASRSKWQADNISEQIRFNLEKIHHIQRLVA